MIEGNCQYCGDPVTRKKKHDKYSCRRCVELRFLAYGYRARKLELQRIRRSAQRNLQASTK